jgi:hypothetical protein
VHAVELGNFFAAGYAPGGPVIQDNHLALPVRDLQVWFRGPPSSTVASQTRIRSPPGCTGCLLSWICGKDRTTRFGVFAPVVTPISDFESLIGRPSAEDESVEEFSTMLRAWRREGTGVPGPSECRDH